MKEMVRYGYNHDVENHPEPPKNTLYTFRADDYIYFGISRCNLVSGDRFKKDMGKLIAKNRAQKALEAGTKVDFLLHPSGLRGVCKVSNVLQLLKYFDDIDANMNPYV